MELDVHAPGEAVTAHVGEQAGEVGAATPQDRQVDHEFAMRVPGDLRHEPPQPSQSRVPDASRHGEHDPAGCEGSGGQPGVLAVLLLGQRTLAGAAQRAVTPRCDGVGVLVDPSAVGSGGRVHLFRSARPAGFVGRVHVASP